MARYRAIIEGSRGQASRLGTPNSGIRGDVDGWDIGVSVIGRPRDDVPDADVFYIYATAGSNGGASDVLLGWVRLDDDGRPMFHAHNQEG